MVQEPRGRGSQTRTTPVFELRRGIRITIQTQAWDLNLGFRVYGLGFRAGMSPLIRTGLN